jgi:acyl-coenzyme A thioesterase PaaI-like protein
MMEPERFRPGHAAGDFLGAPGWVVEHEEPGFLALRVDVPAHVRNPRGQLFGGFTATYVDLVALASAYAGSEEPRHWLATTSMQLDYLAPVTGTTIRIEGRLDAAVGRTRVVRVRFLDGDDEQVAVVATVTMRQLTSPPEPERSA